MYGASAVIDDSQTIITLIGGLTKSTVTKYDLVWLLDTQNLSLGWNQKQHLITEMVDTSQTSPKWKETQDYPLNVTEQACVVFGDELWVSGGKMSTGQTNAVYSWNSTTWQAKPSIVNDRHGHTMVMNSKKVWVISGTYRNSVELYENNAWREISHNHISLALVWFGAAT